jgi:hypothetical protein
MDEELLEKRAQYLRTVILLELSGWKMTDEEASKVMLRASKLLTDTNQELWDRILAHKE